jgi:recombination protein RecA
MAVNLATLRSNVELALAGRVAAPFSYRDRHAVEIVSTGIAEIDSLAGGLPRGALTEIFGPACSGRTTLLLSALAARTAQAEACALIDGCDAFDPHSAEIAGVELKQLLWVRCRNIEQTLRATDLLLQGGGFGFIALDLGDMRADVLRHVPLESWFRFRRAVEDTPTILMVLEPESNAKTCASLVLRMEAEPARWSTTSEAQATDFFRYPPSWLLEGFGIRAELLRSRLQPIATNSFQKPFASADRSELFETNVLRSYLRVANGISAEVKARIAEEFVAG